MAGAGETRGVEKADPDAPAVPAARPAARRWRAGARARAWPAGARRWLAGRAADGAVRPYLALAAVSLLIALYLTWHLLGGLGQRMIAGNPDDVRLFEWYLEHGPQAVLHGRNPLYFTTMNAPAGVNGMWNTSLLFPALLLSPVTLLAGPLAAYNVVFIAGLAAGPVCAFPLMRRFAARDWAAAAGALAFGFSPAVLAAGLGHLNLALTALMPVMMVAVYDLATGRRRVLAGGIALGLLATAELFTSEEVLFQAGLAIMTALVLLAVTAPRLITAAGAARLARGAGIALAVFGVLSGAALWLQLQGPLHQHGSPFTLSYFEADLHGFYLPSHMFWLSTPGSSAFAAAYGGGPAEYLAYLGIPLLAVAVTTGLLRIGDWRARVLLGTGLLFAVFSLGGTLLDGGRQTGVRLPWAIAEHWPLFGNALPDRFAFVVALAAAGLLALAVDWMAGSGGPAARPLAPVLAGALAVVCLAPLAPRPYPVSTEAPVPSFFTATGRWLPAGSAVLLLPYPTATDTVPLTWQAAAGMAFRMPGGYFIGPAPGGQAYIGGPGPLPVANTLIQVGQGGAAPAVTPQLRAEFWQAMSYWRATAIVLGPGAAPALAGFVGQLAQQAPRRAGGVLLWRLPGR